MFVLWSEGQFAVKITIPQNTSFAEGYLLFTTDRFSFSEKNCRSVKNEFSCAFTIPTLISGSFIVIRLVFGLAVIPSSLRVLSIFLLSRQK